MYTAQQFAGPNGVNFQCELQSCRGLDQDVRLIRLSSDTDEQKKRFREDPKHALKYRKMMESELNQRFKFIVQGTPEQKASLEVSKNWRTTSVNDVDSHNALQYHVLFVHLQYANKDMRQRLKHDERLCKAIIPTTFNVGCRRPTPGMGYLEALLEPNVTVYTEMFKEITEDGFIQPDGTEEKVDIFVCAT